jgi:diguanylate cyclase (GGDEF)-like protein
MLRAALLVDLDGFGEVNAALGHDAGDELLRQLAPRLRAAARPEDGIEHLGADEYLVARDGVASPWEARELASRLAAAWAEPFRLGDEEVFVTGSIGIAVGSDGDALLRDADADAALQRAKATGRGGVEVYDDVLRTGALSGYGWSATSAARSPRARSPSPSGTKLGLQLTAEGVETSEHAERLRLLGCPLGQGYMLARQLPADAIGAVLAERLQARLALNEY